MMRKVQIAIGFIILTGHLLAFLYKKDFFPFSPYPMYSEAYTPEVLTTYKVFAVLETEEVVEFKIQKYFPFFWKALFVEALLADKNPTLGKERLRAIKHLHNLSRRPLIKKLYLSRFENNWSEITAHLNSDRPARLLLSGAESTIYESVDE